MSLKAFHIFFITLAIAITMGFAAWVLMDGSPNSDQGSMKAMGICSGIIAVGLVVYGIYFIRKARNIII